MATRLSEELKGELRIIRETALQEKSLVSSPYLKAQIDRAVQDLDEISSMFAREDHVRLCLPIVTARIKFVVQMREQYGQNAVVAPDDLIYQRNP